MKSKNLYLVIFLLIGAVTFNSCKKDDDDDNQNPTPTPPPVTVDSDPQAAFLMNGAVVQYLTGGLNAYSTYFSNSSLLATFPDSSETVYGFGFENILTEETVLNFNKGTFKHTIPSSSTDFTNFFPKQSIPYSVDAANGIEIQFYDSAGELWSTSNFPAVQTGSTFTIIDRKPFVFASEKYIKVQATFNCKLYSDTGASKTITNGSAVLTFWADY